jgi:hypothetical protein
MRLSNLSLLLALALLLAACCTPNLAQGAELPNQEQDLKQMQKDAAKADKKWKKDTAAWKKKLDAQGANQMALLVGLAANNYDVESTMGILDNSQQNCVAQNPDMKQDFASAWPVWQGRAKEAVAGSEDSLTTLLDVQTIGDKKELRAYLDTYKNARATQDAMVKPIPVTSAAECKKLLGVLEDGADDLSDKIADSTRDIEENFRDVLETKGDGKAIAHNN